jgi:hypothetical protein
VKLEREREKMTLPAANDKWAADVVLHDDNDDDDPSG